MRSILQEYFTGLIQQQMKHSFRIEKKQANNRLAYDLNKYQKSYKFINLAYDKKYLRRVVQNRQDKTFSLHFLFVLK